MSVRKKKRSAPASVVRDERKPEWSIVKFEELESWRDKHGIPKKRLAHVLGVTNSTWHNWARGKAVATYATQRRIRTTIDGEPPAEALGGPLRRPMRMSMNGSVISESHELEVARLTAVGSIVAAMIQGMKSVTPESVVETVRTVRRALA